MTESRRGRTATTRRAFIGIAGAATAGAAALGALGSAPRPEAALAAGRRLPVALKPARSKQRAIEAAEQTIGMRLRGSPWRAYFGGDLESWGTAYVMWLLRGVGAPRTRSASRSFAWLQLQARLLEAPEPGAVIVYLRGADTAIHTGFVVSKVAGLAQTVEGDQPSTIQHPEQFVRHFAAPWDDQVAYFMPRYRR